MSTWLQACKKYAEQTGKWVVPKKDSEEYKAIRELQTKMVPVKSEPKETSKPMRPPKEPKAPRAAKVPETVPEVPEVPEAPKSVRKPRKVVDTRPAKEPVVVVKPVQETQIPVSKAPRAAKKRAVKTVHIQEGKEISFQ